MKLNMIPVFFSLIYSFAGASESNTPPTLSGKYKASSYEITSYRRVASFNYTGRNNYIQRFLSEGYNCGDTACSKSLEISQVTPEVREAIKKHLVKHDLNFIPTEELWINGRQDCWRRSQLITRDKYRYDGLMFCIVKEKPNGYLVLSKKNSNLYDYDISFNSEMTLTSDSDAEEQVECLGYCNMGVVHGSVVDRYFFKIFFTKE